jgi:hypothetical protein
MFVPDLPKTRSGKIMRRLLRDIAEGRTLGDTTTLADATVVETIRENTGKAEEGDGCLRLPQAQQGRRQGRAASTDAESTACTKDRPWRTVRGPDRWRLAGRMDIAAGCRTPSTSARPSRSTTSSGARPTGPRPSGAPGLRSVDPYDLILVTAGEEPPR